MKPFVANKTKIQDTNQYYEDLLKATSDLLLRVRRFDRQGRCTGAIMEMEERISVINGSRWMLVNKLWLKQSIHMLERMRSRLVTMMENLLYTA